METEVKRKNETNKYIQNENSIENKSKYFENIEISIKNTLR